MATREENPGWEMTYSELEEQNGDEFYVDGAIDLYDEPGESYHMTFEEILEVVGEEPVGNAEVSEDVDDPDYVDPSSDFARETLGNHGMY